MRGLIAWTSVDSGWLLFGFLGQALFTARFVVQWWRSERARHSVVPRIFWVLSLWGGGALLVYAIHRADPVFIAGQAAGLLIYARNLYFMRRDAPAKPPAPVT